MVFTVNKFHNTVTAAIISFPNLIVRDKSVDITLNVNTTLVPDGSNVSISIPSIKMNPPSPVSGGKFTTFITNLQPETFYMYVITIFKSSGAIIDQPIYGQFTTKEGKYFILCRYDLYQFLIIHNSHFALLQVNPITI